MTKDLVLTTKDLTDVGINAQLSSNDLIEVVASDIYDKYMEGIADFIERGKKIKLKYDNLFQIELKNMFNDVKSYFPKKAKVAIVDEDEIEDDLEDFDVKMSFGQPANTYWNGKRLYQLALSEKEKGTYIDTNNTNLYMPSLKSTTAKVRFVIYQNRTNKKEEINKGKIKGTINTQTDMSFEQELSINVKRFNGLVSEVESYNTELTAFLSILPKNKILSLERFTKDARIKMNKKILTAQSTEFKNKMEQLFNIKLN